MNYYHVLAIVEVNRNAFDQLNVEEALTGAEEEIINQDSQTTTIRVYRRVRADTKDEARQKANDGKLMIDVPHEVKQVEEIRSNDPL